MEECFSREHPFVTVQEAAFICGVSQTTIRSKIKEYKMKTYLDDCGRIHIRTLDLLPYYHKRMTGRIAKAEKELHKAINDRNKALSEYYELERKHDDKLDIDDCAAVYISMCDLAKKYEEVHDTCFKVKKASITIGHLTDFYKIIV